jgi:Na+-driven multidrug efflux pump
MSSIFLMSRNFKGFTATDRHKFLMVLTHAKPYVDQLFIGLGRGNTAMFLLVGRDSLLLFPLLLFLPSAFGINGVWMAQPIANAISFLFILYWTKRQYRIFESWIGI